MIKRNSKSQFLKGSSNAWNKGLRCPHMGFRKGNIPWNKELKGWAEKFKNVGFQKGNELGVQNAGKNHYNWKGEKTKRQNYWWVWKPNHLKANKGRVKQSILVAEKCLGRLLTKEEIVHHIGAKDDDRPEKLYLFSSRNKHDRYEGLKNKPKLKSNIL